MSHINESLLQAYIDGFCDAEESAGIESHIEECEACRLRLDEARAAMSRASELLGALEPGPIHAPAFEELAARAAERQGETSGPMTESDPADAPAGPTPATAAVISTPFWRRPSLAWAATLVLAFGLGWLSRSELGLPIGLESGLFDQSVSSPEASRPQSAEQEAAVDEAIAEIEEAPADLERLQAGADDRVAAEQPPAEGAAVAPATSADADRKTRDEAVAQAPPPVAAPPTGQRTNQPAVAGSMRRAAEPEAQRQLELNEQVGAATFADADLSSGYLPVPLDDAADWLGAAPRQLPELTLVRAEVGPAGTMPEGIAGLPAVRLVYQDQSGQEIVLVQQYLGALEGKEEAKLTTEADRIAPARAGERPEQGRAESRMRADTAELYFFAIGGLADRLPVLEVDPEGRNRRRWIDVDGYLLSLSGSVPPDILLGLVDRIR